MASIDITAITAIISGMEGQIGALKALLHTQGIKTVPKEQKEKKAPNEWILFSQRVQKILSTAGEDKKLPIGQSQQFASSLKAKKAMADWTDADILESRSHWEPPAKSEGEGSTTSSEKNRGPKKLSEMTAEEKAEHDRKVAERRTKREAEKAANGEPIKRKSKKVSEMTPEELAKYREKQEKAKAARAAKATAAPSSAPTTSAPIDEDEHEEIMESAAEAEEDDSFKKTTIKGKHYLINDKGHSYTFVDGEKGEWSGVYNKKTGKFDTSIEEP